MKKAALHNLGCKVNAYETEAMQEMLEQAGYEIVPFKEGADVYIINTCTVTNIADRKSRQMLHRARKLNPDAVVVAAGCYVQAQEGKEIDPCIDIVIGNNHKKDLPELLKQYEMEKSGHTEYAMEDINRTKEYEGLHNMYKKSRSEGFGPEVKRRIMLGSFVLSSGYYDAYYLKALRTKALIKKEFDRAFRNYDIILGPAAPTTAPELGKSLSDPMKMYLGDIYTISVNLAGLPGMSVPVGKDSKGLPIGMQLIGNVFEEKTLIRAAYTYECATKKMHETPASVGLMSEKEVR